MSGRKRPRHCSASTRPMHPKRHVPSASIQRLHQCLRFTKINVCDLSWSHMLADSKTSTTPCYSCIQAESAPIENFVQTTAQIIENGSHQCAVFALRVAVRLIIDYLNCTWNLLDTRVTRQINANHLSTRCDSTKQLLELFHSDTASTSTTFCSNDNATQHFYELLGMPPIDHSLIKQLDSYAVCFLRKLSKSTPNSSAPSLRELHSRVHDLLNPVKPISTLPHPQIDPSIRSIDLFYEMRLFERYFQAQLENISVTDVDTNNPIASYYSYYQRNSTIKKSLCKRNHQQHIESMRQR